MSFQTRIIRYYDNRGRSAVVAAAGVSCIPVLLALKHASQPWRCAASSAADCPPRYLKQRFRYAWKDRTSRSSHPTQSSMFSGSFVDETRSLGNRPTATRHKSLPLWCWVLLSWEYVVIGWRIRDTRGQEKQAKLEGDMGC